ncbi:MAG: DUF2520 domain-containing protein [Microscillaceae bacterium]
MTQIAPLSIIGAGNVATHLARAITQEALPIEWIASRRLETAQALCQHIGQGQPSQHLHFEMAQSRMWILAVSDDALPELAARLKVPLGSIVAHTSGAQPMAVLDALAPGASIGVFYPLQTFSKDKEVEMRKVPFCLEGDRPETLARLFALAQSLSEQVWAVETKQRARLHLAAVFANNFTNWMLNISERILTEAGLSPQLLEALQQETFEKAQAIGPEAAQTGPARRANHDVMRRHLALLQDQPQWAALYQLISQQIEAHYQRKH